jgi:hypothetical protein
MYYTNIMISYFFNIIFSDRSLNEVYVKENLCLFNLYIIMEIKILKY